MNLMSHYTTLAGLNGIASSGTLWATNFLTVNDKSELLYGCRIIQRAALRYMRERVPADVAANFAEPTDDQLDLHFREMLKASDGYGHLFMTSFLLHEPEDDETLESKTHWERFTNYEGYCLQYNTKDIKHMIEMEKSSATYYLIELTPVRYGVDEINYDFKELSQQLGEAQLLQLLRQTRDERIQIDHEHQWPLSTLELRLMRFCGTHKDPKFHDEREIRILAFPTNQNVARPFSGLSMAKRIESIGGKRFLALGAGWKPSVSPQRVIIGPRANPDINDAVNKFNVKPVISVSNISA